MIPLFNLDTLKDYKPYNKVPIQCIHCFCKFYVSVKRVRIKLSKKLNKLSFCSNQCSNDNRAKDSRITLPCSKCNNTVIRRYSQFKKSKSGNIFCNKSCAALYNNAHKTTGTRRSKLEAWLEEQLTINYPDLNILYNDKQAINSELDFYFPDLKFAIELNGIFHYEPIYGAEKLASIKNNDNRKFQACLEQDIELMIIDSSSFKHFKPEKAKKYYDIVANILNMKLQEPVTLSS